MRTWHYAADMSVPGSRNTRPYWTEKPIWMTACAITHRELSARPGHGATDRKDMVSCESCVAALIEERLSGEEA
jgi:hypothetical protein